LGTEFNPGEKLHPWASHFAPRADIRVARFFSGKIYYFNTKCNKREIDKLAIENTNIFRCKAFQNLPKVVFLV
jgi:hypothetical protein